MPVGTSIRPTFPDSCTVAPAIGRSSSRNSRRYANIGYFVSQKELELPEADIRWSVGPAADGYEITLSSDRFVRAVWLALDGNEHFEDNYFDLVPGVSKTVRVATTLSRSEFDRLLRITHLQQTR